MRADPVPSPEKKPAPLRMWAVIIANARSRWIFYPSLARTRRESIRTYLSEYELPDMTWARCRRRGVTCERVEVRHVG